MQGKIGLEEHFAIPETIQDSAGFVPGDYWVELQARLLDIHEQRLRLMDAHGMQMMLLSLNAPTVQAIADVPKAVEIAQRANDYLAEQVAKRPDRFQALAALPLQDPQLAARELERCVNDLKFKGTLVNGFSQGGGASGSGPTDAPANWLYYDLPQYRDFWRVVQTLDVPFYLHPRNPTPQGSLIYDSHPWLMGPTWAFGQETAVHALRLMASGLFDDFPRLQIVLGHLGEGLPYSIWRVDNRNAWVKTPPRYPAKRKLGDYFQENFHLTTSGNFRSQSLIDAILEIGADRVMFSTDWPFENIDHAAIWFDNAPISEADRLKIGRTNAMKLFKLE